MKKFTFIVIFAVMSLFATAQGEAPLQKGEKQLNFGLGFNQHGLPAYVSMDYAVHNDITVGGYLGLNISYMNAFDIAARGDYHFNRIIGIPSNWDFYAGLNLGFRFGFNGNGSGLNLGAQMGGRYYWNEKWGINLEFSGGIMDMGGKFGLTMKM